MKFSDLITLAKAGWTPAEVNSMIDRLENMQDNSDDDKGDSSEENSSNVNSDDDKGDSSEENSSNVNSDDDKGDSSDEKDLKIKELEKQLADAQAINRKQNNDSNDKKTLDELVDDIFKDFYE